MSHGFSPLEVEAGAQHQHVSLGLVAVRVLCQVEPVGRVNAAVPIDEVSLRLEVPVAVDIDPRRYRLIVDVIRESAPIPIHIRDEARVVGPQLEVLRNAVGNRSVPSESLLPLELQARNSVITERPRIAAEFARQMQIAAHIIDVEYRCLVFLRECVPPPAGQNRSAGYGRLMQPQATHGQARHWAVPPQIDAGNPTGTSCSVTALLEGHITETTVFVVKLAAGVRGIRQATQMLIHGDLAVDVAA